MPYEIEIATRNTINWDNIWLNLYKTKIYIRLKIYYHETLGTVLDVTIPLSRFIEFNIIYIYICLFMHISGIEVQINTKNRKKSKLLNNEIHVNSN